VRKLSDILPALLLGIAWCIAIDLLTNTADPPTQWDTIFYVQMAERGITENPELVSPFAYRPAVPLLVRALASLTSSHVVEVFGILTRISVVIVLGGTFLFARFLDVSRAGAAVVTSAIAMSFFMIKIPLFWDTMVDIETYPFMLLAVWFLYRRQLVACGLVCTLGVFFKEFLLIPAGLLVIDRLRVARRPWVEGPAWVLGGLAWVVVFFIVPRLLIPVFGTVKTFDPIHLRGFEKVVDVILLDAKRWLDLAYSMLGFLLPALLLLTRERLAEMRRLAGEFWALVLWYLLALIGLSLFGGADIARFASYAFPILVFCLALLMRCRVYAVEALFMLLVVAVFNRLWAELPHPTQALVAYADVYGGHVLGNAERVGMRLLELAAYTVGALLLRPWLRRGPLLSASATEEELGREGSSS
jgi:hypothetical protein